MVPTATVRLGSALNREGYGLGASRFVVPGGGGASAHHRRACEEYRGVGGVWVLTCNCFHVTRVVASHRGVWRPRCTHALRTFASRGARNRVWPLNSCLTPPRSLWGNSGGCGRSLTRCAGTRDPSSARELSGYQGVGVAVLWVCSILYQRAIYPAESFTAATQYGLSMMVTTDEGLKHYLSQVLTQLSGVRWHCRLGVWLCAIAAELCCCHFCCMMRGNCCRRHDVTGTALVFGHVPKDGDAHANAAATLALLCLSFCLPA
jgi:hypothetical protein